MTEKQQRFAAEYLIDLNAKQAAIRAGYSPKTAEVQGCRLLRNAQVAEAVTAGKARQLATAELSAVRTLEEWRRLAFVDIRVFFDADGNLKPIHLLTAEEAAAIAGFEVIKKNAEAGDGHIDKVHKIKILDKTKTLEMLGKHFGLLTENLKHSGGIDIAWKDSE